MAKSHIIIHIINKIVGGFADGRGRYYSRRTPLKPHGDAITNISMARYLVCLAAPLAYATYAARHYTYHGGRLKATAFLGQCGFLVDDEDERALHYVKTLLFMLSAKRRAAAVGFST